MSQTPPHHGFHGPRCWLLSALAGAILGLVLAIILPATYAPPGDHDSIDAPQVVQINPDGLRLLRLLDGSTVPMSDVPPTLVPSRPSTPQPSQNPEPNIPIWLCVPFAALLISIAVMPFISPKFWHHHFPDFAFFLGALVLAYYLKAFGARGGHEMLHVGLEYYAFIALVGGLYVASGGVLIDVRERASPFRNTALLALGCLLANILGTTGASVLLIRPFMRMNKGRLRPFHVVFFIFIVSNCAGALTPIGDPPLYLGYLKGVPFSWTLTHMWPMWLLVNGLLLAGFFIVDTRVPLVPDPDAQGRTHFDPQGRSPVIIGWPAILFLALLVAGVFIDPLIAKYNIGGGTLAGWPIGATFQIAMAITAYRVGRPSIRHANQFTFDPVKEVGFLFVGIFLTMAPALGYLSANASSLGLESPTQYYFFTGALSAVLDNAPTYLSFLQVALGTLHIPMSPAGIKEFIESTYDLTHAAGPLKGEVVHFQGQTLLEGISLGAVFFGAATYIGNGPNFMVKSIVDSAHTQAARPDAAPGQKHLGTRMPSFFAYILYAAAILLPILILNWFVFIR